MEENEQSALNGSLKLLAKTSVIVFIGIMISKIVSYFYRIVIARYFGSEVYGLFSLALMVIGLVSTIAMFGISSGVFRYIAFYRGKGEPEKIRYIARMGIRFLVITGIISCVALFALSEIIAIDIFHNPSLIFFLKISSIAIPITLFLNLSFAFLLAFEKVSLHSFIYNILQNVSKFVLIIAFVFVGLGSSSVMLSYLGGIVLALAVSYAFCVSINKGITKTQISEKEKTMIRKEVFSYSWPLLFSSIITSIFYWADSFMIGYFNSAKEVGFYNAAIPIAFLLGLTADLFTQLLFPMITKGYGKGDMWVVKQTSQQVGKWIFMLNLPAFAFLIMFPGVFINFLFGSEYIVAAQALRILSIGAFASSVLVISQQLLSMAGKAKTILLYTTIAGIANIILNALLIPRYGINGAAFSTSLSLCVLYGLFSWQAKRLLGILPIKKEMFNILATTIVPMIILLIIRSMVNINMFWLVILSAGFFVLYVALIVLTKSFDKNDWYIIKSTIAKINNEKGRFKRIFKQR